MRCQRCGAPMPDGKIYCEKCGMAVQMVPDYNPAEDAVIWAEEKQKKTVSGPKKATSAADSWRHSWKYGLAGMILSVFGFLSFQIAYHYAAPYKETAAETEEETVLEEKPQFSVRPGTYHYSPILTISYEGSDAGTVHYTTDGTTPDEESREYRAPFSIEEGITVVRAVFIRDDGVQSEEISGTYQVVFAYPDEPQFSVPAGSYEGGFLVTMTAEGGSKIYYTTNGEEPGPRSRLYQGPIYIGPGLTVLQAVSIDEDGGTSAITEAIYNVSEILGISEAEYSGIPAEMPVFP